jgi:hypothetical protein
MLRVYIPVINKRIVLCKDISSITDSSSERGMDDGQMTCAAILKGVEINPTNDLHHHQAICCEIFTVDSPQARG